MLTTLYCDASFCPHQLVGGWAIWLRSEEGRIVENGPVPDYCRNSNTAELAAIYAGIYRAITRWPSTTAILVRSDCRTALGMMTGKTPPRASDQRIQRLIRNLRKEHHVRLIPRWVKGHRYGTDTDVWLNNRVDQMAREIMEQERKAHRHEQQATH